AALGVGERVLLVDRGHDGRPGGDQPVRGGSLEGDPELLEVDDGVEVPTEGQIAGQGAIAGHVDGPVQGVGVGGDVADGGRGGLAALDVHVDGDQADRGVQADRGDRL